MMVHYLGPSSVLVAFVLMAFVAFLGSLLRGIRIIPQLIGFSTVAVAHEILDNFGFRVSSKLTIPTYIIDVFVNMRKEYAHRVPGI